MVKVVKTDNTYEILLVRDVTRLETVEMIVHAESREAATQVALAFASGETPNWPSVQRYNLVDIEPLNSEAVSIDFVG